MNDYEFVVFYISDIHLFVDVLSDEFVGVFDGSLLPGGVGVSEEDRCVEGLCDQHVLGELPAVVCGCTTVSATTSCITQTWRETLTRSGLWHTVTRNTRRG